MNECGLPVTISVLACAIADNKSSDEISLLAAIFTQLGDTLATIATQRDLDDCNNNRLQ